MNGMDGWFDFKPPFTTGRSSTSLVSLLLLSLPVAVANVAAITYKKVAIRKAFQMINAKQGMLWVYNEISNGKLLAKINSFAEKQFFNDIKSHYNAQ